MSLSLKVDVCFSILPEKLSVVVFGSPFLFFKFLIHFSRFPKILLAGVKRVKLAIKCLYIHFKIFFQQKLFVKLNIIIAGEDTKSIV